MKVLLLRDVKKLGRRGEIKEVASGYVRNYLLPRNLVKLSSEEVREEWERETEEEIRKAEEELKESQELASLMDGLEIEIPVKVNEEGKVFGSVNAKKIAEVIKEKGFAVKEEYIGLEKPIKETGEYDIILNLEHGLEVKIKVIVKEGK